MSNKKIEYFGKVDEKGILKIFDRVSFSDDLKDFCDKEVKVIVELKSKRGLNRNAFYWGNFMTSQIDCFKERFGETYTKEQIHEFNKMNFWGEELLIEETGEVIKMPGSSATQSDDEFKEKLENCRAYFRQNLDWELPYPKKQSQLGLH